MSIRTIATIVALTGAFITPLAFAKHAHVQTGTGLQNSSSATQSKTRQRVIQEVQQAQRDGSLAKMRGEATYVPEFEHPARSLLTRDQVNSDLLRAQRDGTLAKSRGEATYAPEFEQPMRSVLTRAEVKQDLLHARHDGVLDMARGEAADFAGMSAAILAH
jgi:hypothetical protein